MDGILSNGCLIIIPGPKQETPTVTPDPYPQPDPQPYPQPAFILTIAVAVAISASIYISTTRRPVSTPFTFETCTDQTRKLRALKPIPPNPTCIDMNPIRREVNEFWRHLNPAGVIRGLQIGVNYSQPLQEFTGCIKYVWSLFRDREVLDQNVSFVNALHIDDDYEHFKLREELQGILDKLEKIIKPAILAPTDTPIENNITTLAVPEVGLNDVGRQTRATLLIINSCILFVSPTFSTAAHQHTENVSYYYVLFIGLGKILNRVK